MRAKDEREWARQPPPLYYVPAPDARPFSNPAPAHAERGPFTKGTRRVDRVFSPQDGRERPGDDFDL